MFKFHYYIVYNCENLIGSCTVELLKKIENYNIKLISDYISTEFCNKKEVVILNWKRIKKG